jgi:hypothetical protein
LQSHRVNEGEVLLGQKSLAWNGAVLNNHGYAMKAFFAIVIFAVAMSNLTVLAQTIPKLAVAGVSVSPTLAKRYNISTVADTNSPVDLQGVWNGTTHSKGHVFPFVLTITKASNGSEYAEFKNVKRGNSFHSTSVSCAGSHVTINFNEGGSQLLDGNLNASHSTMPMRWRNGPGISHLVLARAQMLSDSKLSAGTVAPPVDLDAISQTLDVQLDDHFEAEHMFAVMESDDLESAIPSRENEPYNVKDLETAGQFKKAGISYLLVTTLEELKSDTVDKAQGSVAYQTGAANLQARGKNSRNGNEFTVSASAQKTQGKFDQHRVIEQDVYLTVRCRLFDVASGNLLDSANYSFATNRTYIALAEGSKEVSSVDLFDVAAKNISAWAVARELGAIFPITVLEKNDKEITINRGSDSGLQVGQVYNIYAVGKEIKDPTTGEVLGNDETIIGRASISELQPKFSKAKIWADNGITSGAILRRATAN